MKALIVAGAVLLAGCATNLEAHARFVDVSVYDRTSGRSLPVYRHHGRMYVAGKPGNEYEIIIRNRAHRDVLSVVSVDGVNVISGETAAPDQTGYVIDRRDRVVIKGWRKSLGEVAKFYFTDHSDAYATRTGRPENLGVIGVAVFPRKEIRILEDQLGAAQKSRRPEAAGEAAAPSLGTGHGQRTQSHARRVEFERESSTPAEVVKIFYDSYANLVALGVIPGRRHDPQPFPAQFVPDPSG